MAKLFRRQINLWLLIVLLLFLSLTAVFAFIYFREVIYNYSLIVPQGDGAALPLEYGAWPELANANFFKSVRDQFIVQKASFIEADLSQMKLKVYEEGAQTMAFDILTKGREGSWWETPAGLYRAESKERNHFSSFGGVYQPWSIQFQGNFFIHGWPYYPGGEPVESRYSGGCIRLETADAEKVFEAAKIGMPILVFEDKFVNGDKFIYERKLPAVSGKTFLAADLLNNFVFAKQDENQAMPVASITKLMTALVTVEYTNLEDSITIDKRMLAKTSKPRLRVGQTITAFQLLHPLLMESSNEAAVALSYFLGPERFVDLMNKKAKAIGMEHSQFVDPAGNSAGDISTAEDLFNLAKYLYGNRKFILNLTAGRITNSVYGGPLYGNLENFNAFGDNPDFIGGKVGKSTAARETMMAIFNVSINVTDRPVAIIVLDSTDNAGDVAKVLDYIKTQF